MPAMTVTTQNYSLILQLRKLRYREQMHMYPRPHSIVLHHHSTILLTHQGSCSTMTGCDENVLYSSQDQHIAVSQNTVYSILSMYTVYSIYQYTVYSTSIQYTLYSICHCTVYSILNQFTVYTSIQYT